MATIEKMTIHKALAELKVLDSRIDKVISEGTYCAVNKHSNEKINGISVEEFEKNIQGNYDRATDLINRRKAIKRAVVMSNAVTNVKVGEKEYVVAEAIEMKNHGIEFEKKLKEVMKRQYEQALVKMRLSNDNLEEKAAQYVIGIYGQKEGKTSTADIDKVRMDFITANTYELVNPVNILDKIQKLEKETAEFISEIDAALSVSNALTEITIEY